jgi:hypothetical protein
VSKHALRLYRGENDLQEFWSTGGKDPVQIIRNKAGGWWWATTESGWANIQAAKVETAAKRLSRKLGRRVVLARDFVFVESRGRAVLRAAKRARRGGR